MSRAADKEQRQKLVQFLSFLALPADDQRSLVGEESDWLIEFARCAEGSNFLSGVVYLSNLLLKSSVMEDLSEDSAYLGLTYELQRIEDFVMVLEDDSLVDPASLPQAPEWNRIRELSAALLDRMGTNPVNLKTPLDLSAMDFQELDSHRFSVNPKWCLDRLESLSPELWRWFSGLQKNRGHVERLRKAKLSWVIECRKKYRLLGMD